MGIEPPAISPSSSANSLSIPFPVWSNLKKLSAFAASPCWPHEPTSIWLLPSYLSLVTCSPWCLGIINASSVLSLPDIQIGSSLPTWKTSLLSYSFVLSPQHWGHHQLVLSTWLCWRVFQCLSLVCRACLGFCSRLAHFLSLHVSYAISFKGMALFYHLFL